MTDETETFYGIKPVGQGSWGGYGTKFDGEGGVYGETVPGPKEDPFAQGRTIEQSKGVEIDLALLKDYLWEDRFLISAAALSGIMAYLIVKDPVKYAAIAQALAVGISETVKGVGEVIPG